MTHYFEVLVGSLLALALGQTTAAMPDGWRRSGPPQGIDIYSVVLDRDVKHAGSASLRIGSPSPEARKYGTVVTQTFRADDYRGKRIRLSGYARTSELTQWAAFWLRVDGPERTLGDNMNKRALMGTLEWRKYDLVVDVPQSARVIHIGAVVNGPGVFWMDSLTLEIVDSSVQITGRELPGTPDSTPDRVLAAAPINLGFDRDAGIKK